MIRRIDYKQTDAHKREMSALAEITKNEAGLQKAALDSYSSLSEYYKAYASKADGWEFLRATKFLDGGPPLRILDFGPGRGETSTMLADRGHIVCPVEPSGDFCEVINYITQRFQKDLTIYNSSAEDLDIEGGQFDLAIFNISLHHCDDPLKALKNAHRLLREGGRLLLISEPMLPFFKSQERMQMALEERPDEFGHYGGNEHSYHRSEYIAMLQKAGFNDIIAQPVARYLSKDALLLAMAADKRSPGLRKRIKSAYLNLVCFLIHARIRPLLFVFERLSLVQLTFSAVKN